MVFAPSAPNTAMRIYVPNSSRVTPAINTRASFTALPAIAQTFTNSIVITPKSERERYPAGRPKASHPVLKLGNECETVV